MSQKYLGSGSNRDVLGPNCGRGLETLFRGCLSRAVKGMVQGSGETEAQMPPSLVVQMTSIARSALTSSTLPSLKVFNELVLVGKGAVAMFAI